MQYDSQCTSPINSPSPQRSIFSSPTQVEATLLTHPDPLYGLSFSHSPSHPHRAALTTLHPGPSNKLLVVDTKPGEASDELHSIASVNLTFPATKVAWEPAQSVAGNAYTNGQTELLATTGDVLRIWDLGRDWKGDTSRGYVGRGGAGGGGGYETEQYVLNTRSVLTNVSLWSQ
jgi:WD repeat-containing protein 68